MKINNKILYTIILILVLALASLLIAPGYNKKQKDLGKIELMENMFSLDKNAIAYTYCPKIDWEKLSKDINQELSKQYNETLKEKTLEILNNQRRLCAENKLQIVYSQTTKELVQSNQQAGYNQCLNEAKEAGLIQ